MNRTQTLEAAREAITVDRAATHGAIEDSFAHLAAVWSVRLGVRVTDVQAALMLADLKICRAWGNPGHADNFVDLAGYAACAAELAEVSADPLLPERGSSAEPVVSFDMACAALNALRDGLGYDDIAARGIAPGEQTRRLVRLLSDHGWGISHD